MQTMKIYTLKHWRYFLGTFWSYFVHILYTKNILFKRNLKKNCNTTYLIYFILWKFLTTKQLFFVNLKFFPNFQLIKKNFYYIFVDFLSQKSWVLETRNFLTCADISIDTKTIKMVKKKKNVMGHLLPVTCHQSQLPQQYPFPLQTLSLCTVGC